MKRICIFAFSFCFFFGNAQEHRNLSTVELWIKPVFGNTDIKKDSLYTLHDNTKITFTTLKMFVCDIALAQNIGKETKAVTNGKGVFFLDLFKSVSATSAPIIFEAEAGQYSDLRFSAGVPREINHSDPTSAPPPLDIGKGDMYWSWNSGYIFLLIEGNNVGEQIQPFHFAIGGDANIMPVSFGNLFDPLSLVRVEQGSATAIKIEFDLKKIFEFEDGSYYDLTDKVSRIVHGGPHAAKLRYNILRAFSLTSTVLKK